MKLRRSRQYKRGRIEIIPMIDVMFFLLATFILASLSMQQLNALQVHLPHGKAENVTTDKRITLTITHENNISINKQPVTLATLISIVRPLIAESEDTVIVAADKDAAQGVVVQAMLKVREAGARHFSIVVQNE
jgi:biopolymer transport protein ExbD